MAPPSKSVRVIPADWLSPLPVGELFAPSADGRPRPFEVDIGCGKGRFLLAHAAAHPEADFLGVDRMLRRIRKIDRKAVRRGLANIRLMRMDAYYATSFLVPADSVRTYYIFFPDPWPKKRHHDHRLFNAEYLDALHRTLKTGGEVHFATDHQPYFREVRDIILADARFETVPVFEPAEEERTDFELFYRGRCEIGRHSFRKR